MSTSEVQKLVRKINLKLGPGRRVRASGDGSYNLESQSGEVVASGVDLPEFYLEVLQEELCEEYESALAVCRGYVCLDCGHVEEGVA